MQEERIEFDIKPTKKPRSKVIVWILFFIIACATVLFFIYYHVIQTDIQPEQSFNIEKGMSVRDIANKASLEGLVRSELLLYLILTTSYDPTSIHAGEYTFTGQEDIYDVASKIASKEVEQDLVSVTLPEGIKIVDMSVLAALALPNFDPDDYLMATQGLEGTLFPDTYFVPETFTAQDLVNLQRETFAEKTEPYQAQIDRSTLTEMEIIILASIIEREANDEESMKMVSGILQNRLEINMPLQADATIEYVLDVPISELPPGQLASEIRQKDSPYNTYKNLGLPPTPIGNPGIMAIEAVLNPIPSDYFYYITGNDGEFYYGKTLQQHNQNVANYLR